MKRIILLTLAFLLITQYLFPYPALAANKPVIRPKIGVALGGGGARGAAHIGVLRVFEKEKIPIDYLVGTSAGALIGSLYSGGVHPDKLEEYVLKDAIRKVYKTNFSVRRAIFLFVNKLYRTLFRKPYYAGLYNDHKLHNFVNRLISKEDGSIDIEIPLHVIAVDLITGQPVVIKSGDVGLAVQASTAIPTLRQPIPINDQLLVDGGVINNIPVEEAKRMGADIVIAINVDSKLENVTLQNFRTFEGVITRVINLGLRVQSEHILEKADIIISPDLQDIGILDLDKESLAKAINAGEVEALKMLPKIKEKIEEKTKTLRIAEN